MDQTVSPVHRIAHAMLDRLQDTQRNNVAVSAPGGECLTLDYRGPSIPDALPDEIATADMVTAQPAGWQATHILSIRAPLMVFAVAWNDGEPVRILVYSRGDWEQVLVPGINPNGQVWRREQGLKDALLRDVLQENGYETIPLYGNETPEISETKRRTYAFGDNRDGVVSKKSPTGDDPDAIASDIKRMARALGADLVGITEIRPAMTDIGVDCPFEFVICIGVHESYARVQEGPRGVEAETYSVYYQCARIATELGAYVRSLGWPALAHHNGGTYIQAIPAMYHAGFGELGKHGSLINGEFGASFRPSFVTTSLPMTCDAPQTMGVQDYCLKCNLCTNNCPGEAIPKDFIMTDGHRRWLTDMEKCYPYSRLRADYCHICIDVCPYIHKENGVEKTKDLYKQFMQRRKRAGYRTPKSAEN